MIDIERAREALEKLLELPTINSAARYYARLAMSYLYNGERPNGVDGTTTAGPQGQDDCEPRRRGH
jgi:hypothetical protein